MSKWTKLLEYINKYDNILILLSGGLDSSFLAYACSKAESNVVAVTFSSPLIPDDEVEEARKVAETFGLEHHVIYSDDLSVSEIRQNHLRRCYFCRKNRDASVMKWLEKSVLKGYVVMDGVTESDTMEYRPGLEAAEEDGMLHPLKEAGLRKEDIRKLAREFDLKFWDKPSSPCLATRFPYYTTLSEEEIGQVSGAEKELASLGLREVRVRCYRPKVAVVEVSREDMGKAWAVRDELRSLLQGLGFVVVALDLEGHRSGKMDSLAGGV